MFDPQQTSASEYGSFWQGPTQVDKRGRLLSFYLSAFVGVLGLWKASTGS